MAVLDVLTFPDSRLRRKSQPVEKVIPELQKLAKDMLETMYDFHGIGLSAAQVNRQVRVFVADTRPRDKETDRYSSEGQTELEKKVTQPLVLFNPEIIDQKGNITFMEGCLSFPSYFDEVKRFEWIRVKGLDLQGKPIEFEVDGLLSICIQHEIDHLNGKLFIDRLSFIKAEKIKKKIQKFGYPERKDPKSSKQEA